MAITLCIQLLNRAARIQLQEIARENNVILVVRDMSLRGGERESVFNPLGLFVMDKSGVPVPVSSFLPLGSFVMSQVGSVQSINTEGLPDDPTDFDRILQYGTSSHDTSELEDRVERIRAEIQSCCDKHDIVLKGTLHIVERYRNKLGRDEPIIAGSALFKSGPCEVLKVSLAMDCTDEIPKAEVFINNSLAGVLSAGGKPLSLKVPRGKNTVAFSFNDEKQPASIIDVLKEVTYTMTCKGEGLENAVRRSLIGSESRPEKYSIAPQALEKMDRDIEPVVGNARSEVVTGDVVSTGMVDAYGNPVASVFRIGDTNYWIEGDEHRKLLKFTSDIAGRREFRGEVSEELIRRVAIEWIAGRASNSDMETLFSTLLMTRIHSAVKEQTVAVPIDLMKIARDFWVGRVHVKKFGVEFFDAMHTMEEVAEEDRDRLNREIEDLKTKWKDKAFGVVKVFGDDIRAIAVAIEMVEQSMMLLRFYSRFALDPELPCMFGPLGKMHVPSTHAWRIEKDGFPTIVESTDVKADPVFHVTREVHERMEDVGLRRASSLVRQWEFNELEELVLRCIAIYVHGIETTDTLDRLVFTLSSIETLLNSDDLSTPIQETVALRLGFLCVDTAYERRELRSLLKKAYAHRSKYLHHGKEHRDMEVLRKFQLYVWIAINNAILLSEHVKTRQELFDLIEKSVLS